MDIFNGTLLNDTFSSITNPIVINPTFDNEYTINGFITNNPLSPNSSYHIHSSDLFKRGDIIQHGSNNDYYIVTGDVINPRGNKYKATIDFCNYENVIIETEQVRVGTLPNGRPKYEYIERVVGAYIGMIRHREVSISTNSSVVVANTELILSIQDNVANRTHFVVNTPIEYDGKTFKVTEILVGKIGLLEMRLKSSTL